MMDITRIFLNCLIIIQILSGFCILLRGACIDHSFEQLKKLLPVTILNVMISCMDPSPCCLEKVEVAEKETAFWPHMLQGTPFTLTVITHKE